MSTLTVFAVVILVITAVYLALMYFGDTDRATEATIQSFRWVLVGVLVGVLADAFPDLSPYEGYLLVGFVLIALMGFEYHVRAVETSVSETRHRDHSELGEPSE